MSYLNFQTDELISKGGYYTAKEISSQPDLWGKTYLKLIEEKDRISKFLGRFLGNECPHIILTGAGTSVFIGETLVGPFQKKWGILCRAVGTTDIVTHPENY